MNIRLRKSKIKSIKWGKLFLSLNIDWQSQVSDYFLSSSYLRCTLSHKGRSLRWRAWREPRPRPPCWTTCVFTGHSCWASWPWWCLWEWSTWTSWRSSSSPVSSVRSSPSTLEWSRPPSSLPSSRMWYYSHIRAKLMPETAVLFYLYYSFFELAFFSFHVKCDCHFIRF